MSHSSNPITFSHNNLPYHSSIAMPSYSHQHHHIPIPTHRQYQQQTHQYQKIPPFPTVYRTSVTANSQAAVSAAGAASTITTSSSNYLNKTLNGDINLLNNLSDLSSSNIGINGGSPNIGRGGGSSNGGMGLAINNQSIYAINCGSENNINSIIKEDFMPSTMPPSPLINSHYNHRRHHHQYNHQHHFHQQHHRNSRNICETPPTCQQPSIPKITFDRHSYLLWIVAPLAASLSVAIVIAALAGPQWLLTEEKMPNTNYNGTANYDVKDDGVYITKYTKSSLWILCASQGTDFHCMTIDYFPNEDYSPDPNDSTMAIPYAITRSTPFFLLSGIVLIISYILLLIAMCSQQNGIYYFTSGILFIIAGLLMLIGIIMYISIFKAEVGYKLRPKSALQPPLFTFQYGQSFLLYVIGFIITEFVGILNVFLYIRLEHLSYDGTAPCLRYYSQSSNIVGNLDSTKLSQLNEFPGFGCKKHSIPCFESFGEKRYYLEKSPKCDVHRLQQQEGQQQHTNVTKSLNELYSESESTVPRSPYASAPTQPTNKKILTRSISTATEIYNNDDDQQHAISVAKTSKNNNEKYLKSISNDVCGIAKNMLTKNRQKQHDKSSEKILMENTKQFVSGPFPNNNKGVRRHHPHAADIYYIDNGDEMDDSADVYVIDPNVQHRNRKNQIFSSNRSLATATDVNQMTWAQNYLTSGSYDEILDRYGNYYQPGMPDDRGNMYQSRTLPRNFMKKSLEGFTCQPMSSRRVSAGGLSIPASNDNLHQRSHEFLPNNQSIAYQAPKWPSVIVNSPSIYSIHSRDQLYRGRESDNQSPSPTFDLDRIEKERRKSHASLFDLNLGYNNRETDEDVFGKSTAV